MRPLFVYGTLKRSFDNQWARRLWDGGQDLGSARMRGRLYLVAHCPGLKPAVEDGDWVHGEVCLPADAESVYLELDKYEGAEYRRVEGRAVLECGEELEVWAYEYVGAVIEERQIAEGRYTGAIRTSAEGLQP